MRVMHRVVPTSLIFAPYTLLLLRHPLLVLLLVERLAEVDYTSGRDSLTAILHVQVLSALLPGPADCALPILPAQLNEPQVVTEDL